MGAYPRYFRPIITRLIDYSPDQGHQLDLRWNQSDMDISGTHNDYYSIWRLGAARYDNAIYLERPCTPPADLISQNLDIAWRDGTRIWYFVDEVPGLGWAEYGLIVPTLQDSSSTGLHITEIMVVYDCDSGTWNSTQANGHSVDNMPPYAPARVDIARLSGSNFSLSWDEVTEGGWEGNSYPEVNQITYKVYAGNTPDFEIGPASFLISTTNPYAVLNNQTAQFRFYKIIASDSE